MVTTKTASSPATSVQYHIDFPPIELADDADFVNSLTKLINDVYTVAEEGIFDSEYQRTFPVEVKACVRSKLLAVASTSTTAPLWLPQSLVGSVRINKHSSSMGNFGTLVAAQQTQGTGLGRQLVQFAERHCRSWGATTMQIELLVPTDFEHKLKTWIKPWYERMGYIVVRKADFAKDYPKIAERMITKADYLVFEKQL